MKQTSIGYLIAAVAALAPFGAAQANDFTTTGQTGYFQQAAAMPKSNSDQLAMQGVHNTRNSLGWVMTTYDNPALGAQGPIRDETNPQEITVREADMSTWRRFYPVGASNTP